MEFDYIKNMENIISTILFYSFKYILFFFVIVLIISLILLIIGCIIKSQTIKIKFLKIVIDLILSLIFLLIFPYIFVKLKI